MKEVKRLLIGTSRPTLKELEELFKEREVLGWNSFWCPCFHSISAMDRDFGGFIENHYNAGHYDTPVYKYVWEEDGKIMESLTEPKEDA